MNENHFENGDISKHRKKSKKIVKKSDHIHVYEFSRFSKEGRTATKVRMSNDKLCYLACFYLKCSICNKEKYDGGIFTKEELDAILGIPYE